MSDTKNQPSIRHQIALSFVRAIEAKDKAALSALRSVNYKCILMPDGGPEGPPTQTQMQGAASVPKLREVKVDPLDVMETLDGRVVMQLRWTALRNDGRWIQREEMRIFSFEDRGPFDDPLVAEMKIFANWDGPKYRAPPKLGSKGDRV